MTTRAEAFAIQAASDLDAYEVLAASTLPASHRLHYLQMWLEKLCKAYLWLPGGPEDLRTLHNVVAKVLPRMIAEYWRRIGFDRRPDIGEIRAICREIDLLHPQVDDGERRPDNVEYPWIARDTGDAIAPARWRFGLPARLNTHHGRLLMKAAIALTRTPSVFV